MSFALLQFQPYCLRLCRVNKRRVERPVFLWFNYWGQQRYCYAQWLGKMGLYGWWNPCVYQTFESGRSDSIRWNQIRGNGLFHLWLFFIRRRNFVWYLSARKLFPRLLRRNLLRAARTTAFHKLTNKNYRRIVTWKLKKRIWMRLWKCWARS